MNSSLKAPLSPVSPPSVRFGDLATRELKPGAIVMVNDEEGSSQIAYGENLHRAAMILGEPERLSEGRYQVDAFRLYKGGPGYLTGYGDTDKVRFSVQEDKTPAFDAVDHPAYLGQLMMVMRNTARRMGLLDVLALVTPTN